MFVRLFTLPTVHRWGNLSVSDPPPKEDFFALVSRFHK